MRSILIVTQVCGGAFAPPRHFSAKPQFTQNVRLLKARCVDCHSTRWIALVKPPLSCCTVTVHDRIYCLDVAFTLSSPASRSVSLLFLKRTSSQHKYSRS